MGLHDSEEGRESIDEVKVRSDAADASLVDARPRCPQDLRRPTCQMTSREEPR